MNKNIFSHNKISQKLNRISLTLISIFIILLIIWGILTGIKNYNGDAILRTFIVDPFKDTNQITEILKMFAPLLLGSLVVLLCYRVGMINLNVAGQMSIAGLTTYVTGYQLKNALSQANWILILIFVGIASAVVMSLIIGLLKLYFGVNEVFSGIFFNYAFYHIFRAVVKHPTYVEEISQAETKVDLGTQIGFNFTFGQVLSFSFVIATIIFLLVAIWIRYSKFGFELKVISRYPKATHYSGVNTNRKIIYMCLISGVLSGIAGIFYYYRNIESARLFLDDALPANGFDTLTIVWLSQNSILALPFVTYFMALIRIQTQTFLTNDVDLSIIEVFIGLLILAVAFSNQLYVNKNLRFTIKKWFLKLRPMRKKTVLVEPLPKITPNTTNSKTKNFQEWIRNQGDRKQ